MGYFPNGTSNCAYQEDYCLHCKNYRHDEETDTWGCPIMDLHMLHNYEDTARPFLNHFIPMTGIRIEECKMFLPMDAARCRVTPDMFSEDA